MLMKSTNKLEAPVTPAHIGKKVKCIRLLQDNAVVARDSQGLAASSLNTRLCSLLRSNRGMRN